MALSKTEKGLLSLMFLAIAPGCATRGPSDNELLPPPTQPATSSTEPEKNCSEPGLVFSLTKFFVPGACGFALGGAASSAGGTVLGFTAGYYGCHALIEKLECPIENGPKQPQ